MYSVAELIEKKIAPKGYKYGKNPYTFAGYVPKEFLTTEEYKNTPLVIQVQYSQYSANGQHHRLM